MAQPAVSKSKKNTGVVSEKSTTAAPSAASQVIEGAWGRHPFLGYDWVLIIAVILILFYGLLMLYSASAYTSLQTFGYATYYIKKQLFATGVGLVIMVIVSFLPMKFWNVMSLPAIAVGICLVLLVKTSLGVESNGAVRWLNIGGFSLQPAEVLKFATILILAFMVSHLFRWIDDWRIFFPVFILGLVPAAVVAFVTDDLGTAIIFFGILFVVLALSCRRIQYLIVSFIVIAAAAVYFIMSEEYRRLRIYAWLNIEDYADTKGYQIIQGLYAIGSGGFFGKGIGKSTQKLSFVPEAENDMIFSIICEELGIFGVILLCLLYGVIIWRMKKVFDNAKDVYARLVVAGVAAHIGVQAVVNMCVVTNLLPNTGVPLPFISFGGTSSMILLAEIGLVLSVARGNNIPRSTLRKKKKKKRPKRAASGA